MMIRAYDEIHLDDAMETLGNAIEYATLFCEIDGQEFIDLFITSGTRKNPFLPSAEKYPFKI